MTTIAIIGSGFSGTLLAYTLAKSTGQLRIELFEQGTQLGSGIAYGTKSPHHLLNVPAGRMSAFDADPAHFLRWWQTQNPTATEHSFAPRMVYGQYLQSLLAEISPRITVRNEQVLHITAEGAIQTAQGTYQADRVVFATGNYPPHNPLARWLPSTTARYFANPWGIETLPVSSFGNHLCIVGTGLTAVDIVIDLVGRGYAGSFSMVSRRGLLPTGHDLTVRPHADPVPIPASPALKTLTRWARSEIARAQQLGSDWRVIIDSLRPASQEIWSTLTLKEKRSFMRHLRPFWDVHRHRLAPELHALLQTLRSSNRLQLHSGRIRSITTAEGGFSLTLEERTTGTPCTFEYSSIVNCTGPAGHLEQIDDPLLRSMLSQGIGAADPTGLGLRTTNDGMLENSSGQSNPRFWAMGPLRKGTLWECTAVRELRSEAVRLARTLIDAPPL